jgi:hypothetical protein
MGRNLQLEIAQQAVVGRIKHFLDKKIEFSESKKEITAK